MDPLLIAFFALAVVLRLTSIFVSKRNEARLRAAGAREYGAGNTRLLTLFHVAFYVCAFVEAWWRGSRIDAWTWLGLALYAFAMFVLLHVIRDLGNLWTVKVFIAPGHVLRRSWLFRAVRHPNYYLNVIPELVGVALVSKAWFVLLLLFPCYLAVLLRRINIEERAMREHFPQYR